MKITKTWNDAEKKFVITIDAGLAGLLSGDNILIRHLANQLQADGQNVREIADGFEFDHEFDNLQKM